ncbi:extensin-like [Penaeus monodon]|uniref:extensin-like n=1 Tax=Penaeus monodon TaxID=6687 RepID=UPI0018A7C365|nr:extensin-like [Penaeus monodon]
MLLLHAVILTSKQSFEAFGSSAKHDGYAYPSPAKFLWRGLPITSGQDVNMGCWEKLFAVGNHGLWLRPGLMVASTLGHGDNSCLPLVTPFWSVSCCYRRWAKSTSNKTKPAGQPSLTCSSPHSNSSSSSTNASPLCQALLTTIISLLSYLQQQPLHHVLPQEMQHHHHGPPPQRHIPPPHPPPPIHNQPPPHMQHPPPSHPPPPQHPPPPHQPPSDMQHIPGRPNMPPPHHHGPPHLQGPPHRPSHPPNHGPPHAHPPDLKPEAASIPGPTGPVPPSE